MTRTHAYLIFGPYVLWWYWIIKLWYSIIALPDIDQNANNMQVLCMFCYWVFRYAAIRSANEK